MKKAIKTNKITKKRVIKQRDINTVYALLNKKTAWTWKEIENAVSLSTGNEKLISDENTRFLIWSIPAVKTCPFRTEHCEEACYAVKAETAYPDVLPAREYNYLLSHTDLFVPFMSRLFHEIAAKPAYKKAKWILVRIHESGDFYNVEYMKKWFDIARNCIDIKNMVFQAYTKSLPFYDLLVDSKPLNFVPVASVWDDTAQSQLDLIEKHNMTIYTAYDKKDGLPDGYSFCDCVNCATCQKCYHGKVKRIACEIH